MKGGMPDVLVAETERMRELGWGKGELTLPKLGIFWTLSVAFLRNNLITSPKVP